jgi:hypothetical protein
MKSATIIQSSGKSVEFKDSPLFSCMLEHEVKATKASFEWRGPKITPEAWREVLAFFKWSQLEYKSEAQVRMFVHPEHGWLFWAFPQQGDTGMTTKELDTEQTKKQRAERIPEGYLAMGTVHHHCNAAAFQSGTDEHDEKNVDGIHITVGNMEELRHSIHCRLYFKGHKFEPNMAVFWDIGAEATEKLKFVEEMGFNTNEAADRVARYQLCESVPKDSPFNPTWKDNYMVKVRETWSCGHDASVSWLCKKCDSYHNPASSCQDWSKVEHKREYCRLCNDWHTNKEGCKNTKTADPRTVLHDCIAWGATYGYTEEETLDLIHLLGGDADAQLIHEIVSECKDAEMTLEELFKVSVEEEVVEAEKEANGKVIDAASIEAQNGYHGGYGWND